ncbi:MHC class I-like antigen recognition containing protein [Cricetulus griseus]|nr:MHC class I-like antigen recognition containing protein [Cricetulus griseus]
MQVWLKSWLQPDGTEQESMKWVAGIRFLVWSMLTWVLPVGECALSPSDAASLCYIFTVGKSGSGPWRHKVQGQLNKETFLSYISIDNCHVFGVLGSRLNATKICEKQNDILNDGVNLIKQQASHINNIIREPLTLQVRMHCWHDGDGHLNASWDIDLNGQKILHFDSSTGKLTEVGPGSSRIKELREEDRHVTAFLTVTSQGTVGPGFRRPRCTWQKSCSLQSHCCFSSHLIFLLP